MTRSPAPSVDRRPVPWSLLWLCALLVMALWAGWRVLGGGVTIDADILSLIGRDHGSAETAPTAIDQMRRLLTRDAGRAVFMISVPDAGTGRDTAISAARDFADQVAALPGTRSVSTPATETARIADLRAYYAARGSGLLSDTDRQDLLAGDADVILRRALQALYDPTALVDGDSLRRDPFSLQPRALMDIARRLGTESGIVTADGQIHVPVVATLDPALRRDGGEDTWVDAVETLRRTLATERALSVARTGQVFFAKEQRAKAKGDVQRIALLTGIGVAVMILLAFTSWVPLVVALLTVGSGLVAGLAAVTVLFGTVHAIALVFGASLIGISVDYALHYLAQDPRSGSRRARMRRIRPGLLLGLATSVLGFAALAFSPLGLLTQIAVYSAAGLIAACLTVLLVVPRLPDRPARALLPLDRWMRKLRRIQHRLAPAPRHRPILLGLLAIAGGVGALTLPADDDIRRLGQGGPDLLADARTISATLGLAGAVQVIQVYGDDSQKVLRRTEAVRAALSPLIADGTLGGLIAPSDLIPSTATQEANRDLIRSVLFPAVNAPDSAAFRLSAVLSRPVPPPPGDAPLLLPDPEVRHLLPELTMLLSDGVGLVRLRDVRDPAALAEALAPLPGVELLDPRTALTDQFALYRHWAYGGLLAAMAAGAALACGRHGLRNGLSLAGAPAGAVLVALVGSHLLGVPHNFFTTMALFLVFAIGADYALFLAEERECIDTRDSPPAPPPDGAPAATLAVLLSLISSVLAFGLLATSAVPLVNAIGTVIALGLVAAWVLAPLLTAPSRSMSSSPSRSGD